MSPDLDQAAWDLTPVIKLIYGLSNSPSTLTHKSTTTPSAVELAVSGSDVVDGKAPSLGNFDRLWRELGKPCNLPPPTLKPDLTNWNGHDVPALDLGDLLSLPKSVRWRDDDGITDLEDNQESSNPRRHASQHGRRRKDVRPEHGRTEVLDFLSATPGQDLDTSDPDPEAHPRTLRGALKEKADASKVDSASPPKAVALTTPTPRVSNQYISNPYLSRPRPPSIEPLVKRTAAQRKAMLVIKLVEAFPAESGYLRNLARNPRRRDDLKDEVHVFVDCSNVRPSCRAGSRWPDISGRS